MSQALIQIKKQLTFAEIAPYWFDKLTGGSRWFSDDVHLNMHNCKYCIVGEAHGFKDLGRTYQFIMDYGCEECNGFSFGGTEYYSIGGKKHDTLCDLPRNLTPEELNNHPLVQEFVEHWNEHHV